MMQRFLKGISLKYTAAALILGLAFQGQALAQSSVDRTFGAESVVYAKEAQAYQGQNEHKDAVKQLKKGLKVDGLSAYETSTLYQMMGASYYALGKNDKAMKSFESAIEAGGLSRTDKINLQSNVAQLNIADENYAVGASQLEAYFREGGQQKSKLVKMIVQAHMQSKNRQAAVPWAEVMLRQGMLDTRRDHDVALYLFDSAEKRSSQMQVANKMMMKWPADAALQTKITMLNVKAKRDGVTPARVPG